MTAEAAAPPRCPRCDRELGAHELRGIGTHLCAGCSGMMVAQVDLSRLLETMSADLLATFDPDAKLQPVRDDGTRASCPRCRAPMESDDYCAANLVHFDRCAACHVLWLDTEELGAMTLMWARMDTRIARAHEQSSQFFQQIDDVTDRVRLGRAVSEIVLRLLLP